MEPHRSKLLSFSLRYWLVVAVCIAVWMAIATAAGPWLIRQLHAGRGPAFLVAVLGGRERVAVDHYLSAWDHAARSLSVLMVLGVLLGYIAMRLILALRESHPSGGAAGAGDAAGVTGAGDGYGGSGAEAGSGAAV